jgi:hypothetical protein
MKAPALLILLLAACCSASAQPPPVTASPASRYTIDRYYGTWVNVDAQTGGCTRLEISPEADKVLVHGWGKCHPRDCDWGSTAIIPIAASVNHGLNVLPFDFVYAEWETSFSTTRMKISLDNSSEPKLVAESICTFKDARQAYHSTATFRRVADSAPAAH